jgi:tRNA pseudouridine55 synthase
MATLPEGILLIDKPVGISSFDVIRRLRKTRGIKKMGHAGTLDPLASGLMILAEGKATKLLSQFLKLPKVYEAEVCIGESTTTQDREGEVTERVEVEGLSEEKIRTTLAGMVGVLEIPVPAYSAIKQGGVPLYKKARRGETVEVPIKSMEVRGAEPFSVNVREGLVFATIRFDVGSGTYIRSLAVELGRRLGYPARLENLRRTQVGKWRVQDEGVLVLSAQHGSETTPGRLPKS